MKSTNSKILIAIVCVAVLACAFAAWKLYTPTSTTPSADKAALVQLQTDLQGVTPHFVDSSKANGQSLTPEEQKIKDDIVALLVASQPDNSDFLSGLWLNAIGKRYILVTQPIAESSYDEVIDSQTGTVTPNPESARYDLTPGGRNSVLYIDTQHVYLYTGESKTPRTFE